MCNQGDEPASDDTLLWVVTCEDFWSYNRDNAASQVYKRDKFSAFVESMQDTSKTLEYAVNRWGAKPYGIIRLKYRDVVASGYRAVFQEEHGNKAHVNVYPDPKSNIGKKKRPQLLLDVSEVVRKWGESLS